MNLTDLIARVEGASGADRWLDRAIAQVFGQAYGRVGPVGEEHELAEPYAASVDAALALAERVLPGVWWLVSKGRVRDDEPPAADIAAILTDLAGFAEVAQVALTATIGRYEDWRPACKAVDELRNRIAFLTGWYNSAAEHGRRAARRR